jgi:hypothetical protein
MLKTQDPVVPDLPKACYLRERKTVKYAEILRAIVTI